MVDLEEGELLPLGIECAENRDCFGHENLHRINLYTKCIEKAGYLTRLSKPLRLSGLVASVFNVYLPLALR